MKLDESILKMDEIFETVLASNDVDKGIEMCDPYIDVSLYHSALRSLFCILNAGATFDPVNHNFTTTLK